MSEERTADSMPTIDAQGATAQSRSQRTLPMAGGRSAGAHAGDGDEPASHIDMLAPRERSEDDPAHPRLTDAPAMDRRHALKVMALAAAAPGLASCGPGPGGEAGAAGASAGAAGIPGGATAGQVTNPNARGDLWDPDLLSPVVPWERTLESDELESLAVLCDVILPADDRSPSASEVGAHDFIDEWVSAPYEALQAGRRADPGRAGVARPRSPCALRQRGLVRQPCASATSHPRSTTPSATTSATRKQAEGGPFEAASLFFDQVRYLTLTAFWTTAEGMDDLQYIGNTPLTRWDPPPPEVLRHIGLA